MKGPTFAPAYLSYYPMLAEVANKCGYALACHGSLISDFDLVAIPWTEDAKPAHDLMNAIAQYVKSCMTDRDDSGTPLCIPEKKPHGRVAWSIPLHNGAVIDLSVMPRKPD